jgi:hypothetical protein
MAVPSATARREATRPEPRVRRQRGDTRGTAPSGRPPVSLEDLILESSALIATGRPAACPVCSREELHAEGCASCGSELNA